MLEPPNKKLWYLSHVTVFQNLSTDVLKEIAELSRMRNFEKGAYIETPRKDSELVYFLKEGEVEVYESTSSGRRLTIDILKPGDIFGYGSFTGTGEVSIARQFVKANDTVTLCIMLRSDFLLLLEKRPELALKVIQELSTRLAATESRLHHAALSNAETRVLAELTRIAEKYGEEDGRGGMCLTRKFTHEDLAQLIGTTRETVTRAFPHLIEKGKIQVEKDGFLRIFL